MDHPIKYHNFSSEPENNYAGFGLKSVLAIGKNEQIVKMSADMGLVSNVFIEQAQSEKGGEDNEEQDVIIGHTDRVAKLFFPSEEQAVARNRTKQHLLLTQQVLMHSRR